LGISFGSINSGLPKDIVKQILEAEKIPLKKMEDRKDKIKSKQALLGDLTQRVEKLKGAIYANKSARSFRELQVNTSGDGISASVDKNLAEPGTYQIEVLQLAQKSSAISNGVEDKDKTYLGVGDVYVDAENSSLSGIAKLINGDSENGMHANVVNSGDGSDEPWKLILTLEETGDDNKATFPNLYFIDGEKDIWFDGHRDAQDAKIKLDGFEIEIDSNQATDLIPGVTIDLKKAKKGDEITLEISEDTGKITTKIDELVTNINDVLSFIKEQNALDESTDTSRTLGGDITLQTIESKIRNTIFQTVQTDYGPKRIGDLGLTFQRTGLLAFDSEKFKAGLEKNYKEVAQIVNGKYTEDGKVKGFMDYLDDFQSTVLKRPSGTLTARKSGLDTQVKQIDRRIERKQRQIDKKEQVLKAKFARLEETISKIKSQGNGLAGMSGGFNPVQQLG
jgi:flagellar hook-associated protein 2